MHCNRHITGMLLGALLLGGGAVRAQPGIEEGAGARAAIRQALERWSGDFNAGNAQAACALFAPDLVATYPGSPDRDHRAMCDGLAAILRDPENTYRYDAPHILDIQVCGALATVHLIWTLRVAGKDGKGGRMIRENGLDVFMRQADGSWKIRISHAYTESESAAD